MSKSKILLISATLFEIAPTIKFLDEQFQKRSFFEYQSENISVYPLCTGVGLMATAYALGKYRQIPEMSFAIQAGLAGSFSQNLSLGEVVEVETEQMGDLGVEESDGHFTDVFELGLAEKNTFPFTDGKIVNNEPGFHSGLKKVNGLSVNRVHGTESSISKISDKYACDVESMEGAAFFYACKMQHLKCVQIRSISNYVEKRNKENWRIDLAIESLNAYLIDLLNRLDRAEVY